MSDFYIGTDMRHNLAVIQRVMVEKEISTVRLVPAQLDKPIAISMDSGGAYTCRSVNVEVQVQHPALGAVAYSMPFEDAACSLLVAMLSTHAEANALVAQKAAHLVLPAHGPITLVDTGSSLPTMSGWRARTLN